MSIGRDMGLRLTWNMTLFSVMLVFPTAASEIRANMILPYRTQTEDYVSMLTGPNIY